MNLIFFATDLAKIWAYDEQTQSGGEVEIDTKDAWDQSSAISAYSTNLYLLDAVNGTIWRHTKSGSTFSAGRSYAGSRNNDALGGISMAIDGAIFVLKQNEVIKFSHNIPDTSFVLQMPPAPDNNIIGATQIYTDADSQHILILDEEKDRVLRYAKDGQFVNQYIVNQISIDYVLHNPRVQKMWLLSGQDVHELDL